MIDCVFCGYSAMGCNGACIAAPSPTVHAAPTTKGCICPPTSEQTCQRWDCGRKTPAAINGPFSSTTTKEKA